MINIKKALFFIGLLLLLTQINSTLSVYNGNVIGINTAQLKLQNINFSIANFGFVPFGKTMIGELVLSPNFSDECQFVQGSQINTEENFFMIVPRGHCKFVPKAINAQKTGAKMVIIMDNDTYSEPFIMADNGQGYKVKIPAIFINHLDGQNLIDTIEKAKKIGQKLIVKVNFQNLKTDRVTLNFFLQANNRRSYKLINQFQEYYQKISKFIDINLIYQNQLCPFCLSTDCFFGNQYCAYSYKKQDSANGQDILSQQIRQMIAYQKYPQKWWGLMSYIGDQCTRISELKQCTQTGMKKVGIDIQKIQTAYNSSFNKSGDNKYLKECSSKLMNSGVQKFPSVSINGYNMKGTISAQYLFDDICNSLISPPEQCQKYVNQTVVVTYVKEFWFLLLIIILIGFLIFSGLFILYKRYMKRRMSADMRTRVDDMVSKYIEFYSERSGRN